MAYTAEEFHSGNPSMRRLWV